jgi:hypothetical protein
MDKFRIAHIREQGQDIVIVPVHDRFRYQTNTEQNRICAALQACAVSAGLAGTVVPVWDAGGGRMGFLAPQQWQSFFSRISLADVAASINKELTCG